MSRRAKRTRKSRKFTREDASDVKKLLDLNLSRKQVSEITGWSKPVVGSFDRHGRDYDAYTKARDEYLEAYRNTRQGKKSERSTAEQATQAPESNYPTNGEEVVEVLNRIDHKMGMLLQVWSTKAVEVDANQDTQD